ncbi:pyruvate dehydrogenase (acetyl-transferring), homodimeric type [Nakamurella endophytica]|uniref:Pyruvate dehydrogenase E1 component n=1 Tax=Nakamurella endophytica TaxID=1748367 RepID=A0A917WH39_9ACTN|nr:pyruvate dehydrogenase (acetyl-transferring), homodimeric type [Nakamurella endophytica]GGM06097.1 pyruvate dehydrogenase E1 component [Nakamurella endophytica]
MAAPATSSPSTSSNGDARGTDGRSARHHLIRDGIAAQLPDVDPEETAEWLASFDAMVDAGGQQRARYLMLRMLGRAAERHVGIPALTTTDYINTIPTEEEPFFPGDEDVERRYRAWIRWNAAMMVHRAQRPGIAVGGHLSTYASSATLYEVGYNHFFRGKNHPGGGDHVFFQGHASPGMYARAFLEGRLSAELMDGFRQEVSHPGGGLPSYPHPRLMPDFWEFPTVSMGLGPMNAIQQARVNRYLHHRGIKDTSQQHVWAFLGDGELDEVESRGLIHVAALDGLDNLTYVINCNLQRLDGPVRGNGKIIQELEAFFRGAGWNVIKVIWGREWDALLRSDRDGALVNLMNTTADGDYQTYKANDGAYVREHFFGRDPRTKQLVTGMSDDEIWSLKRGGHDYRKVYAAYQAALTHEGQPTVILAKTIKGFHLGSSFEGRNATHQMKKLTPANLKEFRDELHIPISDAELEADPYQPPYFHPGDDAPEIRYLKERRAELGGFVPERRVTAKPLVLPGDKVYDVLRRGSGKQEIATTMAFVRLVRDLFKDPEIGRRVVPIIPDEARTFGMDSFFPAQKIYNPSGQLYTAVDANLMLAYKESEQGVILHEGINEAGSAATYTAVSTSYATHGEPMIPMYIFYSMFGFQRTGDEFWAMGDQMGRGFILGATAGRTTLTGEGLQHGDGHSHLLAATQPHIVAYDPAYGYEIAHIVRDGLRRMYTNDSTGAGPGGDRVLAGENISYYITMYNEPYVQPAEPADLDVEGLLKGMYLLSPARETEGRARVQLLASGVGVRWALEAQELLATDWNVAADVWSVTSWTELRRDGEDVDRARLLDPAGDHGQAYVTARLSAMPGPVVASSDYQRAVQNQIAPWVPGDFTALGADGFGFSDTRAAARRHYLIDGPSMVVAALAALERQDGYRRGAAAEAAQRYRLDDPRAGRSGSAGGES